jgi:hypothetical protein
MHGESCILNSALTGGEWSNSRLAALPPGRYPLTPIAQVTVWIPEPLWGISEKRIFFSAGFRIPDHPARN